MSFVEGLATLAILAGVAAAVVVTAYAVALYSGVVA